jgi:hypothetical protein
MGGTRHERGSFSSFQQHPVNLEQQLLIDMWENNPVDSDEITIHGSTRVRIIILRVYRQQLQQQRQNLVQRMSGCSISLLFMRTALILSSRGLA